MDLQCVKGIYNFLFLQKAPEETSATIKFNNTDCRTFLASLSLNSIIVDVVN